MKTLPIFLTLLTIMLNGVTAIVFAWDELDNACRKRYVELDNFINS